jgi:glycosyltransferase involved in cell wall biosynthesis
MGTRSVRPKRICFILNNIGDYHAARLAHCGVDLRKRGMELIGLEFSSRSDFYSHKQSRSNELKTQFTVYDNKTPSYKSRIAYCWGKLRATRPDAIFTVGYSDALACIAFIYAKIVGVPIFFMADSKADDQPRSKASEFIKKIVVRRFSGALVAGERHKQYFRSLGVTGPITTGYDVVDNAFFQATAATMERQPALLERLGHLPQKYILCVSRLVERKRLDLVLQGYADSGISEQGYHLVIVGSGPREVSLLENVRRLGLEQNVVLLGSVENTLMPFLYKRAYALVLGSDYDQWGLCVNEAMCLGIPCIVTDRCGVAGEIVIEGETGFVTRAGEPGASGPLRLLASDHWLRESMSMKCSELMKEWDLSKFTASVLTLLNAVDVEVDHSSRTSE